MRSPSKLLSLTAGLALALNFAPFDVPGVSAATVSADAKQKFIASVVSPAQKAQRTYGVPASVSIAQADRGQRLGHLERGQEGDQLLRHPLQCVDDRQAVRRAGRARPGGTAYVLGAEAAIANSDPSKFDCSELVEWLYGRSGNRILTDLAAAQYNAAKKVTGSPKAGDLVFLRNNPARNNGIGPWRC